MLQYQLRNESMSALPHAIVEKIIQLLEDRVIRQSVLRVSRLWNEFGNARLQGTITILTL